MSSTKIFYTDYVINKQEFDLKPVDLVKILIKY